MRLSTALTLALVALLVASTFGSVAASPISSSTGADRSPAQYTVATTFQDSDMQFDAADPKQSFRLNITESGDAEWTVESRFLLTDDSEVEQFEEFATEYTASNEFPIEAFEQANANADESIDREMAIKDERWDEPRTEAPNDDELEMIESDDDIETDNASIGVISYSFTWTNFGYVDGDRIYVNDVFESEHGDLLPFLNSNQQLVIQTPPEYEGVTPGSEDGTYVWDGPVELTDEPDLVFLSSGGSAPFPTLGWVGGILAVLAVAFGVSGYLLAQRRSDLEPLIDRIPDISVPGVDSNRDSGHVTDGDSFTAAGSAQSGGDRLAASESRDAELEFTEDEEVDPSLLSDEERVHRMLSKNGGRMKQATIVKETGWSNAKVSQLLSKMDDDDEIEKLRIGRENLITHPEVDPTEID
ncbi:hypothetical protein HALLA_17155 [Halostagnicola larsenii XH-48]|uniref:HTH iclR-type domain-containing protein n=1 Tax=Halostagnicola larsenii XH-48 TaxID=797299 RepID=W0JSU0_9EURY|nr:hypothetical protein [Halostagnicola larsenii]AHG00270.1 hypothetical protein HALLA_17155 [Halostagnicola larsenii XH-48]